MKASSLKEIQKQGKKLKKHSLFFVETEEPFFVKEALRLLKAEIADPDQRTESFYADEMDLESFLFDLNSLSFFSKPIYLIKNANLFKDSQWDQINEVSDTSDLHIIFTASSLDKRKKKIKEVLNKSFYLELKKPYDQQIVQWINYLLTRKKIRMEKKAVDLIHHYFGSSLVEIENEIDKIREIVNTDLIKEKDIKTYLKETKKQNFYDFSNSLGNKDKDQLFFLLNRLLNEGHHSLELLSLSLYHIRILLVCKHLKDQSMSRISQKLKMNQFFLKNYVFQAKKWSLLELQKAILFFGKLDHEIKTNYGKDEILWQKCILEVLR